MAIQNRRGQSADFVASKMVPGEFAVSQDNRKLYLCFTAGNVKEIAIAEDMANAIAEMNLAMEEWHDEVVEDTEDKVEDAEAWAQGTRGGTPVSSTDPAYQHNAKYYAENIVDNTLSIAGKAADAKKTGDEISDLKEDLENIEPLSDEVKEALLACFQNVVWKDGTSQSYYNDLVSALNGDVQSPALFKNGLGLQGNNSPYIVSIIDNTLRGIIYSDQGKNPIEIDSQNPITPYPIKIPEGATGVRFHGMLETDYVTVNFWMIKFEDNQWKFKNGAGFAKIIPDTVQRTEIAGYNNGEYYMIGTYGLADATHVNPIYNKECDIDTTGFEMEIIKKNTVLFAKSYGFNVPNPVTVVSNAERAIGYINTGEYEVTRTSGNLDTPVYPIKIPEGAKGLKFYGMAETDYVAVNVQIVQYEDNVWKQKHAAGWKKIIPDTLDRTEIANYADGSYYMLYVFGLSDSTHINPVSGKTFNLDISDFRVEVVK